jgi:hypothetical protein
MARKDDPEFLDRHGAEPKRLALLVRHFPLVRAIRIDLKTFFATVSFDNGIRGVYLGMFLPKRQGFVAESANRCHGPGPG